MIRRLHLPKPLYLASKVNWFPSALQRNHNYWKILLEALASLGFPGESPALSPAGAGAGGVSGVFEPSGASAPSAARTGLRRRHSSVPPAGPRSSRLRTKSA